MQAKIGQTLSIGLRPEHNARTYEFDVAKWRRMWPDATAINVIVQRPGDKTAYPAVSSVDGDKVTWTVTRYDTERPGVGAMWVAFTNGDKLLGLTLPETAIIVQEGPDMVSGDTPASETPPWIQRVLDAIAGFKPGEGGNGAPGKDGVTFTPHMSEDGTLSWTNDGNRENPESINLTGKPGKDGAPGKDGEPGATGAKGEPGGTLTQHLDNADFTAWIAQAGICQKHANSTATYAGDRWELVSGTLTAEANEDGLTYKSVALNGVIRQRVYTPPAVGFAGVSVFSGEASAVYEEGIVTVTGSNAVINQVWLTDVESDTPPAKKGYLTEFLNCSWFYTRFVCDTKAAYSGYALGTDTARFTIPLVAPMRLRNPTYRVAWRTNMWMYPGNIVPDSVNGVAVIGSVSCWELKTSGLTADQIMALKSSATIELCSDL